MSPVADVPALPASASSSQPSLISKAEVTEVVRLCNQKSGLSARQQALTLSIAATQQRADHARAEAAASKVELDQTTEEINEPKIEIEDLRTELEDQRICIDNKQELLQSLGDRAGVDRSCL